MNDTDKKIEEIQCTHGPDLNDYKLIKVKDWFWLIDELKKCRRENRGLRIINDNLRDTAKIDKCELEQIEQRTKEACLLGIINHKNIDTDLDSHGNLIYMILESDLNQAIDEARVE